MSAAAIRLRDVGVRLGEVDVLQNLSLDLQARTVAVIGENGSGKSTFARVLGGLINRTSGELSIMGIDPARRAAELRRRIAIVFSNPDAQIIMPTVAEDVAFSLRAERLPPAELTRRVGAAMEHFGLTELAQRPSHDLSGGQKQLLALCGAMVRNPELVIADEPTAYLDTRNARRVAEHLLADAGHRLVLVTHDLALAARCEQVALFADGALVGLGEPEEIISQYEAVLAC